jgi:hypothetical protein
MSEDDAKGLMAFGYLIFWFTVWCALVKYLLS